MLFTDKGDMKSKVTKFKYFFTSMSGCRISVMSNIYHKYIIKCFKCKCSQNTNIGAAAGPARCLLNICKVILVKCHHPGYRYIKFIRSWLFFLMIMHKDVKRSYKLFKSSSPWRVEDKRCNICWYMFPHHNPVLFCKFIGKL